MKKEKVIEKLRNDEHYYGDFGKQYLSNSDIKTLLTNPLALGEQSKPSPAFLVGGYFHTAILEPDKLKKFKIIEASTRNTKAYKEISGGELCLLKHEVDQIELMTDKLLEITEKLKMDFVYKTSFDKANRTSINADRGIGIDESIKIFDKLKSEYSLKILTDVHSPSDCDKIKKHESENR